MTNTWKKQQPDSAARFPGKINYFAFGVSKCKHT